MDLTPTLVLGNRRVVFPMFHGMLPNSRECSTARQLRAPSAGSGARERLPSIKPYSAGHSPGYDLRNYP